VSNYLNQQQISEIFQIAIESGEIAKQFFYKNNFEVFNKNDGSKVSSADIKISKLIQQKIAQIAPNIPIVCEEGDVRNFEDELFFLIDPIDGTSSYINNNVEFCINIALIKNRKPIFGLIYAPLFEGGKMIFNNNQNQIVLYNHHENKNIIISKNIFNKNYLSIITSSRTKNEDVENFVKKFYPQFVNNYKIEKLSSAIKFFRIIEGEANLYLHFRKSMEWDTASGHILVDLFGANLKTFKYYDSEFFLGEELQYKKNNFINGAFFIAK
jgi:3'(2'), 5'-bisphosphate nucleotidase